MSLYECHLISSENKDTVPLSNFAIIMGVDNLKYKRAKRLTFCKYRPGNNEFYKMVPIRCLIFTYPVYPLSYLCGSFMFLLFSARLSNYWRMQFKRERIDGSF